MSKKINSVINNTILFGSIISNTKVFTSVISNTKYFASVLTDFAQYATWIVNFKEKNTINAIMKILMNNSVVVTISTPITIAMFIKQSWSTKITETLTMIPNFITVMYNKVAFVEHNTIYAYLTSIFSQILTLTITNTIIATAQVKRARTLGEWDGYTLGQLDSKTLDQLDWEIT